MHLSLPTNWCLAENNQKLLAGDWNGDGFSDLLCHNQTGEMKILLHLKGMIFVFFIQNLKNKNGTWSKRI